MQKPIPVFAPAAAHSEVRAAVARSAMCVASTRPKLPPQVVDAEGTCDQRHFVVSLGCWSSRAYNARLCRPARTLRGGALVGKSETARHCDVTQPLVMLKYNAGRWTAQSGSLLSVAHLERDGERSTRVRAPGFAQEGKADRELSQNNITPSYFEECLVPLILRRRSVYPRGT